MSILLLLIPLSLLFVVIAGVAFFWAANGRQFDQVDAAAFLPMTDTIGPGEEGRSSGASPACREADGNGKPVDSGPAAGRRRTRR